MVEGTVDMARRITHVKAGLRETVWNATNMVKRILLSRYDDGRFSRNDDARNVRSVRPSKHQGVLNHPHLRRVSRVAMKIHPKASLIWIHIALFTIGLTAHSYKSATWLRH